MAICCRDQQTEFCPHCGAQLKRPAGKTLLAYLRQQQRTSQACHDRYEVDAKLNSRQKRFAERQVKKTTKWRRWAEFVEEALPEGAGDS